MRKNILYTMGLAAAMTAGLAMTAFAGWSQNGGDIDKTKLYDKIASSLYGRTLRRGSRHKIEIVHTTDFVKEHLKFWCGTLIHDEDWHLGDYEITYENGTQTLLPVKYGWNIYTDHMPQYKSNEALGASLPFEYEGKIYYKTVFDNPYPARKIEKITYKSRMEAEVELLSFQTITVK